MVGNQDAVFYRHGLQDFPYITFRGLDLGSGCIRAGGVSQVAGYLSELGSHQLGGICHSIHVKPKVWV